MERDRVAVNALFDKRQERPATCQTHTQHMGAPPPMVEESVCALYYLMAFRRWRSTAKGVISATKANALRISIH